MIEARFDDLRSGSARSFRLVSPVGVIEAHRPGEVAGALEAVGAAAARGLWAAGFVAYEGAPGLDPGLAVRARSSDDPLERLPLVWFAMFERAEPTGPLAPTDTAPAVGADPWRSSTTADGYAADIATIRELIAAGETYQVNYTVRLRATIAGDARGLYRDLALAQNGGYAAYLDTGRQRVVSASPELFFRIDGDRITTRPMKGTIARGRWLEEDEARAARLVSSPKDRAENAMIVDLLRNDLGRIARPGSVRVESMFDAERYETVWQLTSTVTADLATGVTLPDVFRSLFPSGSVTGAPKVRTMQVIAELERAPRGVYCGAIGYLAPPGSDEPRANFNVAIRTAVVDAATGVAEYGVGGGITHDSSAEAELEEVRAKTRVLSAARPAFELFEALRYEPGEGLRHVEEHLRRLGSSARYFGFPFDPDDAMALMEKAVAAGGGLETRVRLTLARDGGLGVELGPLTPPGSGPVRVALDHEPVDPDDVWLFHKTTNRRPYDRRRERRPDVDDVLLMNTLGEVTESTIANLAVRLDDGWFTPPRTCGLLLGTYRDVLVREGRLRERTISTQELHQAEGLALVSSVRGWREAVLVP